MWIHTHTKIQTQVLLFIKVYTTLKPKHARLHTIIFTEFYNFSSVSIANKHCMYVLLVKLHTSSSSSSLKQNFRAASYMSVHSGPRSIPHGINITHTTTTLWQSNATMMDSISLTTCGGKTTQSAPCTTTGPCLHIMVYIVAQWANRYIVAFHNAILYDIYLPGGGGQET